MVFNMVGGAGGGIKLDGISITTPPDNITYLPGEVFDPAGMVVTASYSNGATLTATGWTYSPSGALPEGTSEVEIIYTEAGVTKTAVQAITVERGTISVPTVSGSLTYNGQAQSPTLTGYDADKMVLSGDTSGTNAGSYTAVVTPTEQYKWADGSTEAKDIQWSIAKATPSITFDPESVSLDTSTTSQEVAVGYTGDGVLSAQSNNSGVATVSLSGNMLTVDGVDTGNTAIQVSASEGTNYTAASASLSVAVQFVITIPVLPTQSGSLTYNGSAQSPSWSNYDPEQLTISGVTPMVNAGAYSAMVTPKPGYQWWDGITGFKTVEWTIRKANNSILLSPRGEIILNANNKSVTYTVSAQFGGDISVSWNNPDHSQYASFSVNNKNKTVTVLAKKELPNNLNYISLRFTSEESENWNSWAVSSSIDIESLTSVFGVSWDSSQPSTALTRLTKANDPNKLVTVDITTEPVPAVGTGSGSSPFDKYMPWMGMEECCASLVGSAPPKEVSALYKKGEDGFERTNPDKPVFVKIPEFYYKIEKIGNTFRYYIADGSLDGFSLHPGSGCYVARYEGVKGNSSGTSTLRSNSGLTPSTSDTRDRFRVVSKSTAHGFQLYDFAAWCAVGLLYLVEYADWDSQKKIGQGIVNDTTTHKTGETDAVVYHTGRAAGTDGKTAVQYRGIENPWGNVLEFVDGINFKNYAPYICTDPTKYADDITTNYTITGVSLGGNGWTKGLGLSTNFPWAYLPNEVGGSGSTFIPDYVTHLSQGWQVLVVGGYYSDGSYAGLFRFGSNYTSLESNSTIGARLQFREVKA